ncbi:Proteinase inhibitor I78 [Penicillium griseofulvum]|uniref:Proteinase inhibitor I78 n=1 Tax=Penicillium patulum TaxID=5078 RepID=A0A135L9P8_PENPA|nr:Proteinase inhibitor I78 [Penicillium griseofulvum]KXG45600.1 Proteinase inhibitor I78 [Penicillium griseofulvum]
MGDKPEWINKLMGKTISDTTNETCFAKKDLPPSHRILKPGYAQTEDYKPERLNVYVNDDGTVHDVNFG